MTPDLQGKVALVTGAGRGIGKTISLSLGNAGAHVVVSARTVKEIESVKNEIIQNGGKATAIQADISSENSIISLFENIADNLGTLDILINNAGIGYFGEVVDFPISDYDKIMNLNARGTFICCQQALKIMIPQKSGYIINIDSASGIKGYLKHAAYAASKHAVMGFTKTLALESQEHNIRVSAILPGGVDTELIGEARPDIKKGDLIQTEDIALTVLYLLSISDFASVDQVIIRRRSKAPF